MESETWIDKKSIMAAQGKVVICYDIVLDAATKEVLNSKYRNLRSKRQA